METNNRQIFGFTKLNDIKNYPIINSSIDKKVAIKWFAEQKYRNLNFLLNEYIFKYRDYIIYFEAISENYLHLETYIIVGQFLKLESMGNVEFRNNSYLILPIKCVKKHIKNNKEQCKIDMIEALAQFYYLDYFIRNRKTRIKSTDNFEKNKNKNMKYDQDNYKELKTRIIFNERIIYELTNLKNNYPLIHNIFNRKTESWDVIGHYRHYKSGKTIFIKPYIKGKGKKTNKEYKIKS